MNPVKTSGLAMVVVAGHAGGQCQDWRAGPLDAPPTAIGADGSWMRCTLRWDPDGSGPMAARLVVGGGFTTIDGSAAHNIAAWNGATWEPLGSGTDGTVHALAEFGGDLYAGGDFSAAGGQPASRIARWDGAAWHAVAGGASGPDPSVLAMTVFNGGLIVGGSFDHAGSVAANLVARWDGAAWHPMGPGFYGGPNSPLVRALIVYNGQLYAGGTFNGSGATVCPHIARWNGAAWVPVGPSTPGAVSAMADYNGRLVVTGTGVKEWTGAQWLPIGNAGALISSTLRVHEGNLVVGGQFSSIGGVPANNIALYNGSVWQPLAQGVTGTVQPFVFTLNEWNERLVVGGRFSSVSGQPLANIAQADVTTLGTVWSALGAPAPAGLAMTTHRTRLVTAGLFGQMTNTGEAAVNVVSWDGVHLAPMGSGMNLRVTALESFTHPGPFGDTELIAGGDFTMAGGVAANRVARWIESPIIAFPPPSWSPMGVGFNNTVRALERFRDTTVAAGNFTASGATPINRLAGWTGSAWTPLDGLEGGVNGTVFALEAMPPGINSWDLIVGGSFTSAGGMAMNRIARWHEGTTQGSRFWASMGAGFDGIVRAIERHGNSVYAAGDFNTSGGTPVSKIARWTGSAWVPVGAGLNGSVHALKSTGGYLYAAGSYSTAGGVQSDNIARWNGVQWDTFSGGTDGAVYALEQYHGDAHVGGQFSSVRNGVIESPGWARFLENGTVWIAYQPASASRPCGANFAPDLQVASGYGGLNYQWRKNGVPLVSGPTGTGSTIVGATGNFAIANVGLPDEGDYDCVVTNCGGSVFCAAATLTVTGCCYANCTGGGGLTVADFGCFQTQFVAGNVYADCNQDGALTVADFGCFQTAFAAGCP